MRRMTLLTVALAIIMFGSCTRSHEADQGTLGKPALAPVRVSAAGVGELEKEPQQAPGVGSLNGQALAPGRAALPRQRPDGGDSALARGPDRPVSCTSWAHDSSSWCSSVAHFFWHPQGVCGIPKPCETGTRCQVK